MASRDPSKFILRAGSLRTGFFYQVALLVRAAGSSESSSTSTQVYVQPGRVVGVIASGDAQNLRAGDTLVLDASGSYDEDVDGVVGPAAGLGFQWSCVQTAPVFNATCLGVFDTKKMRATRSSFFTLEATFIAAGRVLEVSVLVSDAKQQRTSVATVTLTVQVPLAPTVSVSASNVPTSGVINAGQTLQLSASVSVPAALGANATWVVDDSALDLRPIALLPLAVSISSRFNASLTEFSTKSFLLAFPGNALPAGQKLTFSLVAVIPSNGQQAVGSVSITVNAAPTPGSFVMHPSQGVGLLDSFQFLALQWVDPDLPLSYQFGYLSNIGHSVVLRSRSELAFGSSLLSAGTAESGFAVVCFAQIFDAYSANSSAQATIQVTESATAMNSSQVAEFVRRSLYEASSDVDGIKQTAAMASYLLNAVNCTLAPNCSELHRQSCLSAAHT